MRHVDSAVQCIGHDSSGRFFTDPAIKSLVIIAFRDTQPIMVNKLDALAWMFTLLDQVLLPKHRFTHYRVKLITCEPTSLISRLCGNIALQHF